MKHLTVAEKSQRRKFLKSSGSVAVAAMAVTVMPRRSLAAAIDPDKQYGMLFDTRRCVGCQACSVACRAENQVPMGMSRSWVETVEKGTYPAATVSFLPRVCNQCSNPQCASVCPTGATYKRAEDGVVVVDADVCIGCKYCIQACPYEARFINPTSGAADKCDFCTDRVAKGLEPACVATCFQHARIFGDLNDPKSEISQLIASNAVTVLRPEMGTKPNVFYIGADHADEYDARFANQHIRINTHRGELGRR